MNCIYQLLPGFGSGDAISTFALQIQAITREWGADSRIYCMKRHVSPDVEHLCEDYRACPARDDPDGITLYHYSVGSDLSVFFAGCTGRRVLVYHNITPPQYFTGIHEGKVKALQEGRAQLRELAHVPDLALGVSDYNRRELEEFDFQSTGVLPLIVDSVRLSQPADRDFLKRFADGSTTILFVGRMAPNKRVEDLIRIFFHYRQHCNANARLLLAGSATGMDRYLHHLRALVTMLDCFGVTFLGHVTDPQLHALYRTADLFITMSEHEGFCIPLLEAIHFDLPVIARDAAALPETLAGTGILVKKNDHAAIAELIDRVLTDHSLRNAVVETQRRRLDAFSPGAVAEKLKGYLGPWL